jgi:hypothetical protein
MAVVVALLGLLALSAMGQDGQQRVVVKQVVGKVEVRAGGSGSWRAARNAMPLRMGWDVRTFVESTVDVEFENGTVLKISENSVITLSKLMQGGGVENSSVNVATGKVLANVKKLTSAKSTFEFETPTAVASIRGTRLDIAVDNNGDAIRVHEGLVMVRRRGGGGEVAVAGGKGAIMERNGGSISLVTIEPPKADTAAQSDSTVSDSTAVPGSDSTAIDSTAVPGSDSTAIDSTAVPGSDSTVSDTAAAPGGNASATDTTAVPQSQSAAIDTVAPPAPSADTTRVAPAAPPSDTSGQKGTSGSSPPPAAADPLGGRPRADTLAQKSPSPALAPLKLSISAPARDFISTEPSIIVKGTAGAGAVVRVNGQEATVSAGGGFSALVELGSGRTVIVVEARRGEERTSMELSGEYRPPLWLNVLNLSDGATVGSAELRLDIEVSEGARFSVNGKNGESALTLSPGVNAITVLAWDRWNNRVEKRFSVTLTALERFALSLNSPVEGAEVNTPQIAVSGSTTAGAKLTVNRQSVPVSSAGFFSYKVPLPNEPGEYSVAVVASYGGEEESIERTVHYRPRRTPLKLEIVSPAEGQRIVDGVVVIQGKVSSGAIVEINGRGVQVQAGGVFTSRIDMTTYGELDVEIAAHYESADGYVDDGPQEVRASRRVRFEQQDYLALKKFNTHTPRLTLTGAAAKATRQRTVQVQVMDQTPEDAIRLTTTLNGSRDEQLVEAGGRVSVDLDEGKNVFSIAGVDMAQNRSNVVSGELYCLPGPLEITLVEPSSTELTISDLPPMPRSIPNPRIDVEVELEDGIGDVAETIEFCQVVRSGGGSSETILLKSRGDYRYRGEITLFRGVNTLLITAQDIAGNRQQKAVTIRIVE